MALLSACGAGSSAHQLAGVGATENTAAPADSNLVPGASTGGAGASSGAAAGTSGISSGTPGDAVLDGGTLASEVYTVTVYYTAVESFHTDASQTVVGCLTTSCSFGNNVIGSYPASFIKAVKTEGTGRITSGVNAGRYLNWSIDVGYWLDTIPSDGYGTALVPFRTAAADDIALTRGTQFRLIAPLVQEDGSALDSMSASRLLAAQWLVNDQFTPGLGGALHLDLYIGEEDRANFTSSPLYTTLANVRIARL